MTAKDFIVIGGDGQLGASVSSHLQKAGQRVHSTIFDGDHVEGNLSLLDLSADVTDWHVPGRFDAAFLCAAEASIDKCRRHPAETRTVNVVNTLAIARLLSERGAAIIFPSTNLVFDGKTPFSRLNDPLNPTCEYGRQKVATERGLLELTNKAIIVRLTKIIGKNMVLFKNWIEDLKKKKTIHPFANMVLSPVPLRFVTETIISILRRRSYGVWHISGTEDVTYEQVARYLAEKIGVSQRYIEPVTVERSGIIVETNPAHTTLDIFRLKNELGIEPPDVWNTIDEAVR